MTYLQRQANLELLLIEAEKANDAGNYSDAVVVAEKILDFIRGESE